MPSIPKSPDQMPSGRKRVMIIAGEASGDSHGAHVVSAMKRKDGTLVFCGIGGPALRAAGVDILIDANELSVVGITEVLVKLPQVFKSIATIKRALKELRPDLMILVDFPDFNLHIATIARKFGVPVLYYISPTVWAWRAGRIHKIKKNVDHMALILPFEQAYYTRHHIPATFVGHPILDYYHSETTAPVERPADQPLTVGLLPGSRNGEIEKNLPAMLAAASQLHNRFPDIRFLLSVAPTISRDWLETFVNPYKNNLHITLVEKNVVEIFQNSAVVIAVSGTVTLETAIHCVPMVIVYRVSPVSYMLGQALIQVEHIGIVNIIAGERIVPELIQKAVTPGNIARTVGAMLDDPQELAHIRDKLASVRAMLGEPGAAERTADIGLAMLYPASPVQ
ncbi:MAG: lipid-A-disaccharide synthase [Desulfosalsimonadaceae bacterium]|nr:lipid-A-disaccharide synthase [Desulfosalsimonadaceae bacterium]